MEYFGWYGSCGGIIFLRQLLCWGCIVNYCSTLWRWQVCATYTLCSDWSSGYYNDVYLVSAAYMIVSWLQGLVCEVWSGPVKTLQRFMESFFLWPLLNADYYYWLLLVWICLFFSVGYLYNNILVKFDCSIALESRLCCVFYVSRCLCCWFICVFHNVLFYLLIC